MRENALNERREKRKIKEREREEMTTMAADTHLFSLSIRALTNKHYRSFPSFHQSLLLQLFLLLSLSLTWTLPLLPGPRRPKSQRKMYVNHNTHRTL